MAKKKALVIGKTKELKKAADYAQVAAGESLIDEGHWAKVSAKCGGEAKLIKRLGLKDKRVKVDKDA